MINGHWNVLIAGARIAGAATALALAPYAESILVADASRPDAFWPQQATWDRTGNLLWAELGLLDTVLACGAPRIYGHTFRTRDDVTEYEYPQCDELCYRMSVPREVLDQALITAACRHRNVTVIRPAKVCDIAIRDDRVRGATIRHHGEHHPVTCDLLVLADGRLSRNAERIGAAVYGDIPSPWSAFLAYFEDLPMPSDRGYFSRRPDSILISTPCGASQWCISAGLHQELIKRAGCHPGQVFTSLVSHDPYLGPAVAAGRRTTGIGGAGKLRMLRRPMSGPGWVLVGDAGYHLDPMTAIGTRSALTAVRILRDRIAEVGHIDTRALTDLTILRDAALQRDWEHTERVIATNTQELVST